MRYYGTICKRCFFVVCSDSLLFNPGYKRFDWHIRYYGAARGTWLSKNTNQIVKGRKTCSGNPSLFITGDIGEVPRYLILRENKK
jgi:hypothetical protein